MAFSLRGERFNVDLSSDDEENSNTGQRNTGSVGGPFVKDITERTQSKPVVAPAKKPTSTGFPTHKKRIVSRFKQQAESHASQQRAPEHALKTEVPSSFSNMDSSEREDIDRENRARMAKMTDAEIAEEQEELMSNLSPSLVQRLLRRANIDEPQDSDFPLSNGQPKAKTERSISTVQASNDDVLPVKEQGRLVTQHLPPSKSVRFESPPPESTQLNQPHEQISVPEIHFPRPPEPPSLDPTSPNFLSELHEKYFPNLAHDPSKLAWMDSTTTPPATAQSNAYAASTSSLPIAALRFSFNGALLPPSVSNSLPTNQGLHHHGDSPEAAGYTIAELAHLARSSFPSQRCFAFQTLGRILYRLGIGQFGKLERGFSSGTRVIEPEGSGDEDEDGEVDNEQSLRDLAKGLWDCMRDGRVLQTLEAEAGREGGHVSAKAYATEALWLWRKGGGTEVRAT